MNSIDYNNLDSGDKGSILEEILRDNPELIYGDDEDFDEDYDYGQEILDASRLPLGFLSDDIQSEILSGDYDDIVMK
mgnify:CR=1 FL=1|jgi:hypothetical protein|tara:strand:+ start:1029 stop:1259 length:231 start_codon:yes stop_codon:yes gene_type:complete